MEGKHDFDIYVGGKIGSFKGISINIDDQNIKPIVKNIQNLDVLTKGHEITTLAWGDSEELDVLIGLASQKVKIYDTDFKAFTSSVDVNCGSGKICGLSRFRSVLVTAVESGHVKVWNTEKSESIIETGSSIEKMRHSAINTDTIATGGKENDLALFNLETKECTFKAKNVRPDMLQLRVPVWVSDMDFLPGGSKVAVCTRYGHVRLYDPSTPQKRPVISMDIPEQALTALAVTSRDHHVVVGSGKGKMMLVDLRKKGSVVQHYKGAVGAIKSIACHKTEPYLVSVGLDRNLLIHNLNSKDLIRKMYLKARLNSVLLHSNAFINVVDKPVVKEEDDIQIIEDDYDELFDSMETIHETSPRKKCKIK
ncbi:WD repeat-containing protein 74 [Periplaneta americana]|uniref:WD repeat-containing protein 74 n=1 Tax=Periplaneta americana TaxID=6978 RepID=UPI0037E88EE4